MTTATVRSRLPLTIHLVVTIAALGADLALLTLGIAGVGSTDPRTVYPAAHLVARWALAPLAVLSLGTGLVLGLTTGWSLFRHRWVTIKLAITTVLTALLLTVAVPGLARMADYATDPGAPAATTAERIRYVAVPAAGAALLILNVALGRYKPRLRRQVQT